jgi:hypothetical protein
VVRPVRAVCAAAAWISRPVYKAHCSSWLARPVWAWDGTGRGRLSAAEGTRGGPGQTRVDLACRPEPLPRSVLSPAEVRSALEWKPWPVDPAIVDRVEISWPSDQRPSAEPPIIFEDRMPDAPAQLIFWQDTGGLLDMWV